MKLKTFTASDIPSAMRMVREALGDNAVILATKSDKSNKSVTITAALEMREDPAEPRPTLRSASHLRGVPNRSASQNWLDDLAFLLRYHSVPDTLAGRLVYKARSLELDKIFALQKFSEDVARSLIEQKALAKLLTETFRFDPLPVTAPASRLMVLGPPGIGKTLSVAKLATQMAMEHIKLTVITTDTKRAGGIDQLAAFTNILELPLAVVENAAELGKALTSIDPASRVLIDTAGCNPYDRADLAELTSFVAIGGFEPVLALPAGLDSFEAADMARAFSFPAIKRLLVTRADTARRFGSMLAAADVAGLALANVSDSARIAGELKALEPSGLAQRMLQYRLQTG